MRIIAPYAENGLPDIVSGNGKLVRGAIILLFWTPALTEKYLNT